MKYHEVSEKFAIREEELMSVIKTQHDQGTYLTCQFKQYETKFKESDITLYKVVKEIKKTNAGFELKFSEQVAEMEQRIKDGMSPYQDFGARIIALESLEGQYKGWLN